MTPRRRLAAVCAVLLAAAAALWGASTLTWYSAAVDAAGRGTVPVGATGAELVPALTGVAVLAVAGVAAAVALSGPPRRVLGALLAAGGAYLVVVVVARLLAPPPAADIAALPGAPSGGAAVPGSVTGTPAPFLACAGAFLVVAAGTVLLVAERGLPRLGARYAAPGGRDRRAEPAADPDRAAWRALDEGRDPTLDAASDPVPDPAPGSGGTGTGPPDRAV